MWTVILVCCFFLVVCYAAYMLRLAAVWHMTPTDSPGPLSEHISLAVIIPVRNESSNIGTLLQSILAQETEGIVWEVIVSDDCSDDDTVARARAFAESFSERGVKFTILASKEGDAHGKKAALARAIKSSAASHILTTDADTVRGKSWIRSVVSAFSGTNASMLVPFTELDPECGIFNRLQALEFAGLTATSGAAISAGNPLMCNGANLAFSRSAFDNAGGYDSGSKHASGDDTFLMLSIHAAAPGSVRFLKDPSAIVTAAPAKHWKEFLHQRVRWITKVRHYSSPRILLNGLLVAGANAAVVITAVAWLTGLLHPGVLVGVFILKSIGEFALLKQALSFAGRPRLLLLFLPAAMLTPFYFIASGWFLLFPATYSWKGRSYRT